VGRRWQRRQASGRETVLSTVSARERRIPPRAASGGAAEPGSARPKPAAAHESESSYDAIAELYDPWNRGVTEDVDFYVAEARKAGGSVVELGVGTGRIAVPIAQAGVRVIGVDSSARMLELCRRRAEEAGVAELLDLRKGDLRRPPVRERVALVTSPFRSLLHLRSDAARLQAFRAVHKLLEPGGRFVFDVFTPSDADVKETHDRWIEREPGIWEHAKWDVDNRTVELSVKGAPGKTTMHLAWVSPDEWRALLERAGFEVEAFYGWFDRSPYRGDEDTVWIARRPAGQARRRSS
jgi:SAM-dependent methyltransferase